MAIVTTKTILSAILGLLCTVQAVPPPNATKTIIISPSSTSHTSSHPSPTYAFHETIYGTQAKALVGVVMPVLVFLAIIPIGLTWLKRQRERRSDPNWKLSRGPQSYQKHWSSRYRYDDKCELDVGQEKFEMAGGNDVPEMEAEEARCEVGERGDVEMEAEEARCEVGERGDVEMAVEELRAELGDGEGDKDEVRVTRDKAERRKTWRESMSNWGNRKWSRQSGV